jgi:SIR2-like domain
MHGRGNRPSQSSIHATSRQAGRGAFPGAAAAAMVPRKLRIPGEAMPTKTTASDSYDAILAAHQQRKTAGLSFRPEDTNSESFKSLRLARDQGTLSLVLGAGCSVPFGLPSWDRLVSETVCAVLNIDQKSEIARHLTRTSLSSLVLIRFLKAHDLFDQHFFSLLKQRLYRNYNASTIVPYFDRLAGLVCGTDSRPAPHSVLTYNFDNVLQQRIERSGRPIRSIYDEATYRLRLPGFPIYHPHGYLPYELDAPDENNVVVLSEEHYHGIYNNPYNWANVVQLTHFCHNTCLFIGMSFRDPNVRRLLDLASDQTRINAIRHFAIMKHQYTSRRKLSNFADYLTQKSLRLLGVEVVWINDYEEIASVIDAI